MDGAGRFKRTIHVTLPAIAPIVVMTFILNAGSIVNDGFDRIFNLYNPAVYSVSDVLSTYIYRMGILTLYPFREVIRMSFASPHEISHAYFSHWNRETTINGYRPSDAFHTDGR